MKTEFSNRDFVVATHNQKKRDELQRILEPLGFRLADIPLPDVEETSPSHWPAIDCSSGLADPPPPHAARVTIRINESIKMIMICPETLCKLVFDLPIVAPLPTISKK